MISRTDKTFSSTNEKEKVRRNRKTEKHGALFKAEGVE